MTTIAQAFCPKSPTGQHIEAASGVSLGPHDEHDYTVRCACCGAVLRGTDPGAT
jgi:hypothetical protein